MLHLPRTSLKLTMASSVLENFIIKCNVYCSTVKRTGTNTTGVSSSGMSTFNTTTKSSGEIQLPSLRLVTITANEYFCLN